ncbi:OsmC family protein [Arcicella lustrica]|uniref:OsmC family protein n=1 Tax=Arcicella lustrica TaxID=2984196 RepID=A0ABU5SE09_9BACT|nr:OsmC family protein [Arcicella sp. DC25W]MEA5425523.1 OsmC family protein [Arcicella sp. DC25W]
MQVELVRIDDAFHFQANGMSGVPVDIDAAENIGGHNAGSRPMELLLMGLGGCTAIDVILIMKKQRQVIEDLKISVSGEREKIEGTEMTPFRKINIHFQFKGNIVEEKAKKAIELSMEKYCSATAQFSGSAEITHTFEIEPVLV